MNPPARPLKTELNDALVGGIRERGSEAVGFFIIAVTRIVIAVLVVAVQLLASVALGYGVTVVPFAGMTVIGGLVSWLTTRKIASSGDDVNGQGRGGG